MFLDVRDQPNRKQGVASELEEIVLPPNRLSLEHPLPNARQHPLSFCLRGIIVGRNPQFAALDGLQRPPIHLAVAVEREGRNSHKSGGNHGRRHYLPQEILQRSDRQLPRLPADEDRLELLAVASVHRDHGAGLHCRVPSQHALNLTEFDPMAADFYLIVEAAEKLQFPSRQPPAAVAGAVEAFASRPDTADEDKFLG